MYALAQPRVVIFWATITVAPDLYLFCQLGNNLSMLLLAPNMTWEQEIVVAMICRLTEFTPNDVHTVRTPRQKSDLMLAD